MNDLGSWGGVRIGGEHYWQERAKKAEAQVALLKVRVDDLATLVARLANYFKNVHPDNGLLAMALDYLRRHELLNPLRAERENGHE